MPLNCKPGDLALIIRCPKWAGKVVTCERLLTERELALSKIRPDWAPLWVIDRELTWTRKMPPEKLALSICPDSFLMPIRPEPDEENGGRPRQLPESEWRELVAGTFP